METFFHNLIKQPIVGSYRTYEEWKLCIFLLIFHLINKFLPYLWGMETSFDSNGIPQRWVGSYRTYEEWKHYYDENKNCHVTSSYRTYEEWKHR